MSLNTDLTTTCGKGKSVTKPTRELSTSHWSTGLAVLVFMLFLSIFDNAHTPFSKPTETLICEHHALISCVGQSVREKKRIFLHQLTYQNVHF